MTNTPDCKAQSSDLRKLMALALGLFILLPRLVLASPIVTFEATDLPDTILGDRWRYDYSVSGLTNDLQIVFDYNFYSDLSNVSVSDANVFAFETEPFAFFGLDGYLDIIPLVPPAGLISVGLEFTWLGNGTPGSQSLLEYDSSSFGLVDAGQTTAAVIATVPEPPLVLLLATGCLLLARGRCLRGLVSRRVSRCSPMG